MSAMDHLQAVNTLATERYLLDEMTEAERHAFEAHIFSCRECAADVREGALMRDGVREGLLERSTRRSEQGGKIVPMPAASPTAAAHKPRWSYSIVLPWAAAAMLTLVVGYQSMALRPPPRDTAPSALSPATLRPASRGEEPTVMMDANGRVTLAVDLGDAGFDGGAIAYQLSLIGGTRVASGELAAPQAGMPLLLLIPSRTVEPGAHCVLRLQNVRNTALTPMEYRFTVGKP